MITIILKRKLTIFTDLVLKMTNTFHIKIQRLMNALEGNLRIVEDGGHFLEEDGFETFTALQDGNCQDYMTR